jgi:hypothetical protein
MPAIGAFLVIPAKAGIHSATITLLNDGSPAFAGMTVGGNGVRCCGGAVGEGHAAR